MRAGRKGGFEQNGFWRSYSLEAARWDQERSAQAGKKTSVFSLRLLETRPQLKGVDDPPSKGSMSDRYDMKAIVR